MDNWYALQVLTGKEAEIAARLRRSGIQAIAPDVIRVERKDGSWGMVARRAIPGYIFLRARMTTLLYYHLMGKPGVIKLLGVGEGHYTAIPDEQMKWIAALGEIYGAHPDQTSHATRCEGGEYEITDGPLLALRDKITKIDMRRKRATVAIELYDETYEIDMAVEAMTDDNHPESPAG